MRNNSQWDLIVLTVGNENQKKLCMKLISRFDNDLSEKITVVSDDEMGCRIGSGGAVINVLKKFGQKYPKILILNSGGFSKRCINYAIKGKAFADLEYENQTITLLELILKKTESISQKISSGVLICCSDILIDADCEIGFNDNIGFCNRADVKTGSRHGVMFCDSDGTLTHYLHKRSPDELLKMGQAQILVDTGMVFFRREFVDAVCRVEEEYGILERIGRTKTEINLYPDMVSLLSENIDESIYLFDDAQNDSHIEIRKIFLKNLSGFSLKVCEIDGRDFVHFGTLRESVENISKFSANDRIVINSFVSECEIGKHSVIDNAVFEGSCSVGEGSAVSDIVLENVSIPDRTAVCGIKLRDGSCITICCDIEENPKELSDGITLWEKKRFYKGDTFTQSYLRFTENSGKPDVSLADCTENADFNYPFEWLRTLDDMKESQKKQGEG